MAHASYYNPALHGTLPVTAGTGPVKSVWEKFNRWRLRNEARRQLRNLPDYLLDDIGITRYDIENHTIHF